MTKNEVKVKEMLKEDYVTPSSAFDGTYTKTTQFMLPVIGINWKNKLILSFFENAYFDDAGHEHRYERPIFALFKVADFASREWAKVYSALVKCNEYVNDYDIGQQGGKNLVMVVFKVPKEFGKDYNYFKHGMYSKFSETFKKKFPRYIGDKEESLIWGIMNKSAETKRKVEEEFCLAEGQLDWPDTEEIWDKPRKTREVYRYECEIIS